MNFLRVYGHFFFHVSVCFFSVFQTRPELSVRLLFLPGLVHETGLPPAVPFLSMPLFYTPSIYNSIFYSGRWNPGAKVSFLKGLCAFYLPAPTDFSVQTPRPPVFLSAFLRPFLLFTFPYIRKSAPCRLSSCRLRSPPHRMNQIVLWNPFPADRAAGSGHIFRRGRYFAPDSWISAFEIHSASLTSCLFFGMLIFLNQTSD